MERNLRGTTGQTGRTGQVREQAKQQGQQLAQQAREQASELATRGGEQLKSQLETQKHQAAQRMMPVQMALRETALQLRRQGQGPVAGYTEKASDQVERFSGYLRETEVEEITEEVRGFARRRPALFLGSAALLGFLGTRFLKSSSQEGGSSGQGVDASGTATSSAMVSHGSGEPATALPPGSVEGSPAPERAPLSGPPRRRRGRTEPPRGF